MDDILYRNDGWYWVDSYGYLIGPYETRGEAAKALSADLEYENEYELDLYLSDLD